MTRAATQDEISDHRHDLAKHTMTYREISDELDRIQREIRETAARSQAATKEAMRIIDNIMAELGIPLAKESAR